MRAAAYNEPEAIRYSVFCEAPLTATELNTFASATTMLDALRARDISARELLELHLARIDRYNGALNAIVTPNVEAARDRADEADRERAHGEERPLLGLPLTIKDCIYMEGLPTTGGVPERATSIDRQDALLTGRVRAAGAVIMGKTNVPPYASDWKADNPVFGRSNNPWDLQRTPGGSTGGGAAAVAAGLTPLEFGGDFMGSIRIPAAFCGIYGHKSSLSAVPGTGHFPAGLLPNAAARMAVLGPLAREAGDLDLALQVVAGPEVGDEVAWKLELPAPRHSRLDDFRIAVLPRYSWLPVDDEIAEAQERLIEFLQRRGVRVEETQPEGFGDLLDFHTVFTQINGAISGSGMPSEIRERQAASCFRSGDEFLTAYGRGLLASAAEYLGWYCRREQYRAAYRAFFRSWDVLLAPANIVNALPHMGNTDERTVIEVNGQPVPYFQQGAYAGLTNLTGSPATAFPAGLTAAGLPIGLQVIGPDLEDRTPIRFAQLLTAEYGGFTPPPGYLG